MTYNLPSKVPLPPELDKKAKNIHTRMAVYFDAHIYDEPEKRDDTLLFQYLYHIIYMLACRKRYFSKFADYDAFALFMATRLYMRYINPKHTEKCGKIKSVLNYCKALIGHNKTDFQAETFGEIFGMDSKGNPDGMSEFMRNSLEDSIQQAVCAEQGIDDAVLDELLDFSSAVREVVDESPYRKDTEIYHRLYMSTYISMLNSITLSTPALRRLAGRDPNMNECMKYYIYDAERNNCIVLWRLDDTYENMVRLFVVKARKKMSHRIGKLRRSMEIDSEDLNAVIMSAYGNTLRDNSEEII